MYYLMGLPLLNSGSRGGSWTNKPLPKTEKISVSSAVVISVVQNQIVEIRPMTIPYLIMELAWTIQFRSKERLLVISSFGRTGTGDQLFLRELGPTTTSQEKLIYITGNCHRPSSRALQFQVISEIRTGTVDPIPVPISKVEKKTVPILDRRKCVANRWSGDLLK